MTKQRMLDLLIGSAVISAFLAVSLSAMPVVLFLLAKEHILAIPAANGPQSFLVIGFVNGICILPVFIGLHVWRMSPVAKGVAYVIAGIVAPFPLEFLATMGFSALADESEMEGRVYSLEASVVLGAISGVLFGFLTWRRSVQGRRRAVSSPSGQ